MSFYQDITQRNRQGVSNTNVDVTVYPDMPRHGRISEFSKSNAKSDESAKVKNLWQKTDVDSKQEIDSATLEPYGVVNSDLFIQNCEASCQQLIRAPIH